LCIYSLIGYAIRGMTANDYNRNVTPTLSSRGMTETESSKSEN